MIDVPRAEFEELVGEALDGLPPELARLMDNVAIFVEDESPPGMALFGLYQGIPLTQRANSSYMMAMPDRITIYRLPALRVCWTLDQVRDHVRVTVVHEIAHHFGIDDDRLEELGYG
jgi:predicted Zn-dependent protease with MMP-like domain